ncbi:hypothetical protein [Rubrivirga sp.]|uniref:hypothetical protein n=1 Tax=Rubrivirga sp. TaxID=1885344 RepID=UPI003B5194AF
MRLLLSGVLVLTAVPALGQPVAALPPAASVDASLRAELDLDDAGLLVAADWEAPPVLYWAGVAVDVGVLVGGAYVLVQSARLLAAADDGPWPGQLPAVLFGSMGVVIGVTTVGFAVYDLVRVLRGDDPALARLFDPTRPLPGGGPRFPPPPRPPY